MGKSLDMTMGALEQAKASTADKVVNDYYYPINEPVSEANYPTDLKQELPKLQAMANQIQEEHGRDMAELLTMKAAQSLGLVGGRMEATKPGKPGARAPRASAPQGRGGVRLSPNTRTLIQNLTTPQPGGKPGVYADDGRPMRLSEIREAHRYKPGTLVKGAPGEPGQPDIKLDSRGFEKTRVASRPGVDPFAKTTFAGRAGGGNCQWCI